MKGNAKPPDAVTAPQPRPKGVAMPTAPPVVPRDPVKGPGKTLRVLPRWEARPHAINEHHRWAWSRQTVRSPPICADVEDGQTSTSSRREDWQSQPLLGLRQSRKEAPAAIRLTGTPRCPR